MTAKNKNGQMWFDCEGAPIQAHGGMILKYGERYYWYGENKAGPNVPSSTGGRKVDFIGISCYSSANLIDWENKGLVLAASTKPNSPLSKERIVERPKVIYNHKTATFVLWFHSDDDHYLTAACGVAVADSPLGPFTLKKVFQPNRKDSRDMTLYQEGEKAYLIHSSDFNKTLYVAELTDDYQDVTGLYTKLLIDQEREAPTVFNDQGQYFMITSGTTGWEPNGALYSRSPYLFSPSKLIDNPCEGENYRQTFFGQSSYVFKVEENFYLMLDHWQPDNLQASGYSILPIEIIGKKKRDLSIPWRVEPFGGRIDEGGTHFE